MKPALIFAAVIVLVLLAIALLNPAESHPLLIDAAYCEPIDHRTPGYRHPWEPVVDRSRDPRSVA